MDISHLFGDHHLLILQGDEKYIAKGLLIGKDNVTAIPVVNNMVFYNEADLFIEEIMVNKISEIYKELHTTREDYKEFLRIRHRMASCDLYACFHPFNESSKAFFPFISMCRKNVKPGDMIIDLWNRSGWSTSFLSGLFPENHIVTVWEGNKDVLGYKGFNYWFGKKKNITPVFLDLNQPLPFADNTFSMAYGIDALHRYNQPVLLKEILRIVKKDGGIFFPHVHLTNSEPEPFFERGCRQLHGKQYDQFFRGIKKTDTRTGFIFSEPELFWFNEKTIEKEKPVISTPDTKDYNSTIAILPDTWAAEPLVPYRYSSVRHPDKCFIIINPIFEIHLDTRKVVINKDRFAGGVDHMLTRHPSYMKRIIGTDGMLLSEHACKMLYWSGKILSLEEIREKLSLPVTDFNEIIHILEEHDIIQVTETERDLVRLQLFVSLHRFIIPYEEQTLRFHWQHAVKKFPDQVLMIAEEDGSEFTFNDSDLLVRKCTQKLQQQGIKKGDIIGISAPLHPETLILFWSCMQLGVVVAPISNDLPLEKISGILKELNPVFIFTTKKKSTHFVSYGEVIVLDDDDSTTLPADCQYFSGWIGDTKTHISGLPELVYTDLAVILYTSGSTGNPRGVMLSHGNLLRSGRLMVETYQWKMEDRFFAPGDLDSMSGLRNAAICPLEMGSSVIIPSAAGKNNILASAESIFINKASIIASNPTFFRQAVLYKDRIRNNFQSLRLTLCTGSDLSENLEQDFKIAYGLRLLNYYGLTETSGICIAESINDLQEKGIVIGKPVDCIAQIVDENGNILSANKTGELRIYSENITQGYFKNIQQTREIIRNGWLYTGDYAMLNKNGSVKLMGRKRDIIKTAMSELVYSSEIENCLLEINEVKEASVCMVRQDDIEKIAAFVVIHNKYIEGDIISSIMKQIFQKLGSHKIPSIIKILRELPYNQNGKVYKQKLIETLN